MSGCRRSPRSEVDWLQPDVECSSQQWHPKNVTEENRGLVTVSESQILDHSDNDLDSEGSVVTSHHFHDSDSNNESLSVCESDTNSTFGEECAKSNDVPQDDVNLPNMSMEVGCIVIGQNMDADATSYINCDESSDNGEDQTSDINGDELSDDDSIVDAVIHLSSAESQFHLAMADDDDNIHSLNSYVCFPDP